MLTRFMKNYFCVCWSSLVLGRFAKNRKKRVRFSGETNPKIWDSNPNESFAYFEKDSHESDSNPNPKIHKKLTYSAKTVKKDP
jgi:hypothetical protein